MKKFKMLMMSVLAITSVSIFAQVAPNKQTKLAKQNTEKATYNCPLQLGMVMDNSIMCHYFRTTLNLSLKEKMKREAMKIDVSSTSNNEVRNDMLCSSSQNLTVLNLSHKEKMKWEAKRMNISHLGFYVNGNKTCQMMKVLITDRQISCMYCSPSLNLSPKEKMKREAMKI